MERGQGELILLVEDEPTVLKMGARMLEKIGYRVLTASDGLEALCMLENRDQDVALIISDLVLPILSGTELFDQMTKKNPAARILVWTGLALDPGGEILLHPGVADWILKPPDFEELAIKIRSILDGRTDLAG